MYEQIAWNVRNCLFKPNMHAALNKIFFTISILIVNVLDFCHCKCNTQLHTQIRPATHLNNIFGLISLFPPDLYIIIEYCGGQILLFNKFLYFFFVYLDGRHVHDACTVWSIARNKFNNLSWYTCITAHISPDGQSMMSVAECVCRMNQNIWILNLYIGFCHVWFFH